MIRLVLGIIGIFVVLPIIYGKMVSEICSKARITGIRLYALGFMAELSVFYVLYLVMLRINRGLGMLTKANLLAAAVVFVILVVIMIIRHEIGQIPLHICNACSGFFGYIKSHPLIILFFAIVIWELIQMITYTEVAYSDDDTYSPMILDMVASGGFFGVDPDTGYAASSAYIPAMKYRITAWLPFQAFGSIICDIHPLIFTKTILPCVLIIMHYLIVWELAGVVTKDDNRAILMIVYALLMELGWSSMTTTLSYYFLTWLWYGKAFVQFITVPLLLVEVLHAKFDRVGEDATSDGDKNVRGRSVALVVTHVVVIGIVLVAGCGASPMGVFLGGAEAGLLVVALIVFRVITKRKKAA